MIHCPLCGVQVPMEHDCATEMKRHRDEAREVARYLRIRLKNRGGDTDMVDRVYCWLNEAS